MSETAENKSVWERTPDARYLRDAAFRQIVDMMEAYFHQALFTPTEMREAALLAAIHYEQRCVRGLHGYTMSDEDAKRCWSTLEELHLAINKDDMRHRVNAMSQGQSP